MVLKIGSNRPIWLVWSCPVTIPIRFAPLNQSNFEPALYHLNQRSNQWTDWPDWPDRFWTNWTVQNIFFPFETTPFCHPSLPSTLISDHCTPHRPHLQLPSFYTIVAPSNSNPTRRRQWLHPDNYNFPFSTSLLAPPTPP